METGHSRMIDSPSSGLPDESAFRELAGKRKFWLWLLIISTLFFILVPIAGALLGMEVFSRYSPSVGAVDDQMQELQNLTNYFSMIRTGVSIGCLSAFVMMVVSLVRFFSINSQVKILRLQRMSPSIEAF